MEITQSHKMADIIHLNHNLLSVLYRFNISLGFGEKDVETVCVENKINVDFFLEISNIFNDKEYFNEKNLQSFSAELIVKYLLNTHNYYTTEKIPEIFYLIKSLKFDSDSERNQGLIKNFFDEYRKEFQQHILREEEYIYPYVISLQKAVDKKEVSEVLLKKIKENSIESYGVEHGDIEEKLYDLKNIIIKYLPPPINSTVSNVILSKLFKLESDLNQHSHIENKVMIPVASRMEKEILFNLKLNKFKIIN